MDEGLDDPLWSWFSDFGQQLEDAARSPRPPGEQDQQRWRWALRVLHEYLGTLWLERELDPKARGGYLLLDGPSNTHDNPEDGVIRLSRAFNLALDLHDVREVGGFPDLVRELGSRSLRDASAEVRVLNHLREAGEGVEFRAAAGKSGKSFDATVLLSGLEVAVEVKARTDQPANAYTLRRSRTPSRRRGNNCQRLAPQ